MKVTEILDAAERSQACERILGALPDWFGIESAVRHYVAEVAHLETLAVVDSAEPVGFVSLKRHTPLAAEIYVMGVVPERHREGIGSALVRAAESRLRSDGVEYLQVKTLGPSRVSDAYARTLHFYEACGFAPLEEIHGLWNEGNPCLILVKRL
jgi:ribosomal protein S18 acetylase RimI-like enzyme